GKEYVVMDKAANIRYLKPGKGTLKCIFEVDKAQVQAIKDEIDVIGKKDYTFLCQVKNEQGEVVTEVEKIVYVRKKDFNWDSLDSKV
ncbi:MAG: DUF4442 domain-containing protein, partial [Cytophagales bacterium]|nr:DUF4442 domain-containing protein [Cytophagales bacterium]